MRSHMEPKGSSETLKCQQDQPVIDGGISSQLLQIFIFICLSMSLRI